MRLTNKDNTLVDRMLDKVMGEDYSRYTHDSFLKGAAVLNNFKKVRRAQERKRIKNKTRNSQH
jgi:hypothetical protein